MRILPSWSTVMNAKRGSTWRLTMVRLRPYRLRDRLPKGQGSAAEGIDADLQTCRPDGIHVDDVAQIFDIRADQIPLMGEVARCDTFHVAVAVAQKFIRAILYPGGDIGIGGAAIGRVVLEAAVCRRIVRRRDHDSVGRELLCGRDCKSGWRGI